MQSRTMLEQYRFIRQIYVGGVYVVSLCRNKTDEDLYVVKTHFLDRNDRSDAEFRDSFEQEVTILRSAQGHPGIVRLFGTLSDSDSLSIVLEYCQGGSLLDVLHREGGRLSEIDAAPIVHQILQALHHVHTVCKAVHRDVKIDNILINSDDHVKLADFEFAVLVPGDVSEQGVAGSIDYMSPEQSYINHPLQEHSNSDTRSAIDCSSDLWSLGVVIFVMVTGRMPFTVLDNDSQTVSHIRGGSIDKTSLRWTGLRDVTRDLISRLLVVDPKKRITAQEALNHDFFRVLFQK